MPSDEMILWCLKQKTGIRLEEPNDQLCKSYLKEANDALVSMNANINAGLRKWAINNRLLCQIQCYICLVEKGGRKIGNP